MRRAIARARVRKKTPWHHVVVIVAALVASARAGDDDEVQHSESSAILDDHARALEQLIAQPTHTAPLVKDAFVKLANQARHAPTLRELREKALTVGSGTVEQALAEDDIEGADERDRWIAAREALYALSALGKVGLVDDDAFVGETASGEDDYGAFERLTETGSETWYQSALQRAALMGDDWARTALGFRLWKGFDGVEKDEERALSMLRDVATTGLGRGPTTYELEAPSGAEWLRDRDRDAGWYSESIAAKAADQVAMEIDAAARGDDGAHAQLGYRALVGGRGVEQNERAAFEHFVEAARRRGGGLPEAHYNLGFMYMNGMGTEKNYTAAREEFLRAISKGQIAPAYNGLGVLAFNGLASEQNYTEAMLYFTAASKLEDPDGYFNLAQMYTAGHGVEANATYGLEIMEKASELGHWRAPYELGMVYALGEVVEKNVTKAARYFHIFIEERFNWAEHRNEAIEEVLLHQNPWGALVRYALVSSLGSESAANNVAWLLRKTDAYTSENKFELAARMLREIIYCYESPEARVDLAGLLSERKVRPDLTFDLKDHYDQLVPNASTYEIAATGHLSVAAFGEKPYAEALVNLGWAHLFGRGVAINASRSLELFAAGAAASETSYEATPCVFAIVMTKFWLFAAAASRSLSFGSLGLPAEHFSALPTPKLNFSTVRGFMAVRILRLIEVIERYVLFGLSLALAGVLAYRAMLPSR